MNRYLIAILIMVFQISTGFCFAQEGGGTDDSISPPSTAPPPAPSITPPQTIGVPLPINNSDIGAAVDPKNPFDVVFKLQLTQAGCVAICFSHGKGLAPPVTLIGTYSPAGCPGTPVATFSSSPLPGSCCCY